MGIEYAHCYWVSLLLNPLNGQTQKFSTNPSSPKSYWYLLFLTGRIWILNNTIYLTNLSYNHVKY